MLTPREKFQELLKKLFQFDCAELDFGIYRIMNQKRAVIERFIEKDLLDGVAAELSSGALAQESKLVQELADVTTQIKGYLGEGALDPEGNLGPQFHYTTVGKQYLELRERVGKSKSSPELEAEIFNHLYAFFSRYYDDGDFMSLRRYSKRDKYAIPYNGEEVYLHWANSDQYYIKTGENFTDYSYKHDGWTVRFKLRSADVEQNNAKGAKRFFIPRCDELAFDNAGRTVTLPFEFRPLEPDEEIRYGKGNNSEGKRGAGGNGNSKENGNNKTGQDAILADALAILTEAAKKHPSALAALMTAKREDADGNPVCLIEHHLRVYTRANTSDFFIHEDLKGFLDRELDFYLKNEVLNLDELDAGGEARSESWFQLLRTIKAIGRKIVAFVAQIENFQKRLFEKKKFVSEVQYCVTLDRVPQELYPEIAKNEAQIAEWRRLFRVHEIEKHLTRPGYTDPLKADFLQANPFLVLDTKYFTDEFTSRLIASDQFLAEAESLDEATDGLLIYGENFQALRLIRNRYKETLRCIYIDPPYNTDAGPILYKNGYRSSTWMGMIENRLIEAKPFLADNGIICVTIDDYQVHELAYLLDRVFGKSNQLGVAVIRNNPSGRSTVRGFSVCHEYAFFYRNTDAAMPARLPRTEKQLDRFTQENGIHVDWRNFRKDGGLVTHRAARPKQFYPIYVKPTKKTLRIPNMSWIKNQRTWEVEKPAKDEVVVWPIDEKGKERVWSLNQISARDHLADLEVRSAKGGDVQIFRRHIPSGGVLPRSWWDKNTYAAREYGSSALTDLFGASSAFSFAKSPFAVQDCIWVAGLDTESSDCVLDFFAGSGTTAHAVINLNREDDGRRQYVLVEMADYFETVLKPRIEKVIYSKDWKDGKPVSRQGSSHTFKYLRLESYEDALDNITFQTSDKQVTLQLEDYSLNYLLDFETKESDTLLSVTKLDSPFDYTLHGHGKDRPTPVDLPETFNYLIGLHVASRRVYENKGTRYLVYRGRAEGRETVILWRTTRGWGEKEFEADKEFVERHKLTKGAEDILVNSDSFIPGARSLDPVFKRRMFNEE